MSNNRDLGYCGTRAVVGKDAADGIYQRRIPGNIDMDFVPDQDLVAQIVREEEACEVCEHAEHCHP